MDPRFLKAFEDQVRTLTQGGAFPTGAPFDWIFRMVNDEARAALPSSQSLRADGMLFLIGNIAGLIVIPWEATEGQNFRNTHGDALANEIRAILAQASFIASQRGVLEISASILLRATADRTVITRMSGPDIWG